MYAMLCERNEHKRGAVCDAKVSGKVVGQATSKRVEEEQYLKIFGNIRSL